MLRKLSGSALKINLVDLKSFDKIFERFLKSRPRRDNPRSASDFNSLKRNVIFLLTSSLSPDSVLHFEQNFYDY